MSTWSTARELEYVLRHADATTLVTVHRFPLDDVLAAKTVELQCGFVSQNSMVSFSYSD